MYLSESKTLRILTLCSLYVAQGMPYGFVSVAFAAWLTQDDRVTLTQLGPIMAVATLPWSFKFVWGPLMDTVSIRRLGRRRPWIILAQSMAIIALSSLLLSKDLPGMVWTSKESAPGFWKHIYDVVPGPLALVILIANVFLSMQDVAVDALAVDLVPEQERGTTNGLTYGCSYLGSALGGWGLGLIIAKHGIRAGITGQSVFLAVIILLPILIRERPPGKKASSEDEDPLASSEEPDQQSKNIVRNLLRAFSLRATLLGLAIALGCRICNSVINTVLLDFLRDKDGGDWDMEYYTTVTGGYALVAGFLGATTGGIIADRLGTRRMIITMTLLVSILWLGFGLFPRALYSRSAMTAFVIGQDFLFGMLLVSLFTLFMSISWPRVAATQFTTYMSIMNLSTTMGHYISGQAGDSLAKMKHAGIPTVFLTAACIQVLIMIPALFIDPNQTRRVLGDE